MIEQLHIAEEIEAKARTIANQETTWIASPRDTIQRELKLTLEHIDEFRNYQKQLVEDFLNTECDIRTKLLQKEENEAQRESHLLNLEQEKRRINMTAKEHLRTLEYRLLALLEKHLHLTFDDD